MSSAPRAARQAIRNPQSPIRNGFTLVEMLVAVGLVVLMMSLFATIFQFATQSMAVQKGTAENDQKVRLVLTLLRSDLDNRTFRYVLPFRPTVSDPNNSNGLNPTDRQGYFYIGENDPDDDTDDVLQLTVEATDDLFYGSARALLPDINGDYGPGNPGPVATPPNISSPGVYWRNQPEFDDGLLGVPNGAGSGRVAEVSYFLRGGTLYRRVMLLRNPALTAAELGLDDYSPTNHPGNPLVTPLVTTNYEQNGQRNFWTDFDYSAIPQGGMLRFHGASSLDNATGGLQFVLGKPNNRFGFNFFDGLPREWVDQYKTDATAPITAGRRFIGRFTQQETSHLNAGGPVPEHFGYPGRTDANAPNPFNQANALTYRDDLHTIEEYLLGTRVGEDILMTGVQRFDIKVWDEGASLGADNQPGIGWLPGPDGVFDNPPGSNDDIAVDDDGANGNNDGGEVGWPDSDDGDFRDLGHEGFFFGGNDVSHYSRGQAVFPTNYQPINPLKNPGPPVAPGGLFRFDSWHYEADLDLSGAPYDDPPFRAPDVTIAGVPTSRPLKAIQIRITFFDQTSQQLRDITFVQSLVFTP